jgi:hypothetical protein
MTAYEQLKEKFEAMHTATGMTFELMEQRIAKLEAVMDKLLKDKFPLMRVDPDGSVHQIECENCRKPDDPK